MSLLARQLLHSLNRFILASRSPSDARDER
jgi:hypothetical protein